MLNNNYTINPVILSDLPVSDRKRLMDAINDAWQSRWGWPRYSCLRNFEYEASKKEHNWVVIKEQEEFIGGVFYIIHDPAYPDKAYFGSLWTSPGIHKTGLGSSLVAYIEEQAKKQGKTGTHIVVNPELKQLINFYKRRGYLLIEESRQFPGFMRMEKTWDSPEEGHLHRPDKKAMPSDQLIPG